MKLEDIELRKALDREDIIYDFINATCRFGLIADIDGFSIKINVYFYAKTIDV
jgi:hypothetical protein